MNLTMSVEMTRVLFLLCSGLSHFTFASNRLRVLCSSGTRIQRSDVSHECNDTGDSYVTLYDEEDAKIIESYLKDKAWLGLNKGRNITWSNGEPVTFNKIPLNVSDDKQLCVAINTTWEGFRCSEEKPFMCDKGGNYTLIESKKSWCQALQYCRIHFDDLASINNDTQNENAITAGKNTSFWIGLMLDEWQWEDGSCSSFRKWAQQGEGDDPEIYAQYDLITGGVLKAKINDEALYFCSKGNVRIIVIDIKSTWEQAYDYCKEKHTALLWINDESDQNAVHQWLNQTNVNGSFWIGLRQSHVFGFWIWSDRMVNFSNFKTAPPPEIPLYNQCGAINKTDGQWREENCSDKKPFLCEEEIVFMNKSKMRCASSWFSQP